MGVPYYFYQIYKKYNNETKLMITENDVKGMNVDHLFFDYNSMIHPCAHQVISSVSCELTTEQLEEKIIENCIIYTNYILNLINPKSVHITIDGVAPKAKINQQRERRYKSYRFKQLTEIVDENVNENKEEKMKITWDSNKITPGTLFMTKLKNSLNEFTDLNKYRFNITISDSDECGEGEHKMMQYINTKLKNTDNICIYGLDADLIMLSMINERSDKIILLRDNSFNEKLKESERIFTYLDIKRLRNSVCNEIRYLIKSNSSIQLSDNQIIHDYTVLCFLLGNDFLEHIPSLNIKDNGINMLLKSYVNSINKHNMPLINIGNIQNTGNWKEAINLKVLVDIFDKIASSEDYYFTNVYSPYKQNKTSKQIYKENYNLDNEETKNIGLYFQLDDFIKYNQAGMKHRYYSYYGITNTHDACEDYLRGIYWIFGYYNNHIHQNWTWSYKYNATPFASDLYEYLKNNLNKTSISSILEIINIDKSEPNTQLEQLLMVLPKESLLNIIREINTDTYEKLLRLFRTNSNDLNEIFPDILFIDMIHKEYLWQSKILFKKFDNKFLRILL